MDSKEDHKKEKDLLVEKYLRIKGIGPKVANSLAEFFSSDHGKKIIKKLKDGGVGF